MINLNLFRHKKNNKLLDNCAPQSLQAKSITPLSQVTPGEIVKVTAFGGHLSSDHRVHFIAYGLQPGTWVEVLQQSPVTIIKFDNTELALEKNLSREILCQG